MPLYATECPAHHKTLNLEHGVRLASYKLRPVAKPHAERRQCLNQHVQTVETTAVFIKFRQKPMVSSYVFFLYSASG